MTKVADVCQFMNEFSPMALAEDWDNVGLLIGDRKQRANHVMTCLTVTPESVAEAIDEKADMIVTHHPVPFQPIKKITADRVVGQLLIDLIRNDIAVYSPHTGFDSASQGINQAIADRLELQDVKPIEPSDQLEGLGSGRFGVCAESIGLQEFASSIKQLFGLSHIHLVGELSADVSKVGIACGSGGSFLNAARKVGCDTMVTGETNFHTCLEARATGVSMVLLGHYGSERFAVEMLANRIQEAFPEERVWASSRESDPVRWV